MTEPGRHRASMWDDFGSDPESRVVLYERAAAMADAGELSGEDAEKLLLDYRNRVIKASVPSAKPDRTRGRSHSSNWTPEGVGSLIAASIIGGGAIWWPASLSKTAWSIIIPGLVLVAIGTVWVVILRGRYRFRRRGGQFEFASELAHIEECLEKRMCPDCGYSLKNVPAGIGVLPENGLSLGPRACPECGVKWPLVPSEKTW